MRQLLIKAFKDTVGQIRNDLRVMPLERWNESVFRFIYSRAVTRQKSSVRQFTECKRIDLVLHHEGEWAFLEFKFYGRAASHDPMSGKEDGWKGGPSKQNCREFKDSVDKLKRFKPPEALKLVALFYSDPPTTTGKKRMTFDSCYGGGSRIEAKLRIRRLVSIGPFLSNRSVCNAKLFQVTP